MPRAWNIQWLHVSCAPEFSTIWFASPLKVVSLLDNERMPSWFSEWSAKKISPRPSVAYLLFTLFKIVTITRRHLWTKEMATSGLAETVICTMSQEQLLIISYIGSIRTLTRWPSSWLKPLSAMEHTFRCWQLMMLCTREMKLKFNLVRILG